MVVKSLCYSNEGAALLFRLLSKALLVSAESAYVQQQSNALIACKCGKEPWEYHFSILMIFKMVVNVKIHLLK